MVGGDGFTDQLDGNEYDQHAGLVEQADEVQALTYRCWRWFQCVQISSLASVWAFSNTESSTMGPAEPSAPPWASAWRISGLACRQTCAEPHGLLLSQRVMWLWLSPPPVQ